MMERLSTRPTPVERLMAISGVGQDKAQALVDAGYESPDDLREASQTKLAEVEGIGMALAARIKADVGTAEDSQETLDSFAEDDDKATTNSTYGEAVLIADGEEVGRVTDLEYTHDLGGDVYGTATIEPATGEFTVSPEELEDEVDVEADELLAEMEAEEEPERTAEPAPQRVGNVEVGPDGTVDPEDLRGR